MTHHIVGFRRPVPRVVSESVLGAFCPPWDIWYPDWLIGAAIVEDSRIIAGWRIR